VSTATAQQARDHHASSGADPSRIIRIPATLFLHV